MLIKTEAIVIKSIRYSESDLIVKCFTKEYGVVSYMIRGVLKSKRGKLKASFFQTGSFLDIDAIHKQGKALNSLKEVKPQVHFKTLHSNIIKSSILTFLFEIINQVMVVEEPDEELYGFFKNAFLWLEDNERVELFHTVFLINFTRFLGCYPDTSDIEGLEFDLKNGNFTSFSNEGKSLRGELLLDFKLLLGMKFDKLKEVSIFKERRKELLNSILEYYSFHVTGYKEPNSLLILEQLFK